MVNPLRRASPPAKSRGIGGRWQSRVRKLQLATQAQYQARSILVTHSMSRATLSFNDVETEAEYRAFMFPKVLRRARLFGFVGGIGFTAYMVQGLVRERNQIEQHPKFFYSSVGPAAIIYLAYPLLFVCKARLERGNDWLQRLLALTVLAVALAHLGRDLASPRNIGYVYQPVKGTRRALA